MLLQDNKPTNLVEFKQAFSTIWLTTAIEVDVMTAWRNLNTANCKNLEDYNNNFW